MKIPDSVPWRSTGETLGSGGQANIYLVTRKDQPDGRNYALKVLRHVDSQQARERFQREIEAVKSLDHQAIAKIIDHSKPDDTFQYYVMDYYEGAVALDDIIFTGANPFHGNVLKSLDLFEQLVIAIRACEQSKPPIIHRDISPKNILVLQSGMIRLIDFGICQIQDGQILTLIDENVGARNYTAPECEAGNDAQIGTHSDLYSAAKVLWSIITSQRAFAREEPAFGGRSMLKIFPTNSVTWYLNEIFEKTIRANPADRFQKTEELINHIREVRYLIEHRFPPLEEVGIRCPSCGRAQLIDFPQGHSVFGNPNPAGVVSIICRTCGFGFVRNTDYLRQNIERLRNLK
jgi:serine/threonine protein kinase